MLHGLQCPAGYLQDDPKLYENHTCGPPRTPTASDSEPPRKRARTGPFEQDDSALVSTTQQRPLSAAETHVCKLSPLFTMLLNTSCAGICVGLNICASCILTED